MKVEDLNKSKAYKKLNMSDVEKSELLETCKSKKKELKSDIPDLSIRRIEKMKKENKHAELIKKVAVASVSLIASGAIIFGLIKHNEKKDVNVSKNTVATESTKENNKIEKEEVNVGNEYVRVFDYSYGLDVNKVDWSYLNTAEEQAEYGGVIYEVESTIYGYNIPEGDEKEYRWLAIKGKNDEKFTEIKDFKFWNVENVYSNGKYIISAYEKCIYKYDIDAKKLDVIDVFKDKEFKKKNHDEYCAIWNLISIRNDMLYLSIDNNSLNDLISYNIINNKIKMEKDNIYFADDCNYNDHKDGYDYIVVQYKDSKGYSILSLFSYTSDGLVEEKKISKNVEIANKSWFMDNILVSGKIPYFGNIVSMKGEFGEYKSFKKVTLYFYDVQSGKEMEIANIDMNDFGGGAKFMDITNIYEDYCEVDIRFKDESTKKYKYTYATKKIVEVKNKKFDR